MKRNFNKKKLMLFGALGLFAIALVTAGLLTFYGQINQNPNVVSAVEFTGPSGICTDNACTEVYGGDMFFGDTLLSEVYSVKNIDPLNSRDVKLETTCRVVDGGVEHNCAIDEIDTSYVGVLELSTKNADGNWDESTGQKATVEYSIVGNVFSYKVIWGEGSLNAADYKLIYYEDNSISTTDAERLNTLGTVHVIDENIGSLPYATDWNAGEYANYCVYAPDMYEHCKGAKLWLVPNLNAANGLINWAGHENFLYETDLIVYSKTTENEITLPAGGGFDFMVENTFAGTGDYTITTEVLPVTV